MIDPDLAGRLHFLHPMPTHQPLSARVFPTEADSVQ
jgi:hypothetical protein